MFQLIFYFMDGELQKANAWSGIFIGAAIEIHRLKGPGLLEPIYTDACAGIHRLILSG